MLKKSSLLFAFFCLTCFVISCSNSTGEETVDGDKTESDFVEKVEHEADSELVDGDDDLELDSELEEVDSEEQEGDDILVGLPPKPDFAPSLLVRPEDKDVILARIDKEPFKSILEKIRSKADREHRDLSEPNVFDSDEQINGETAQYAAFLAWLENDTVMADKARNFLKQLSRDYHSHLDFDINIRLPSIVICYANALDLLIGGGFVTDDEIADAEDKLTYITSEFYKDYVLDSVNRFLSIYLTQNNHPIRTACSIGYIAMAFPDHPDSSAMADWAFSEINYLYGTNGQYIQPDGGVSEGPHYYRFGFGAATATFLGWRNRIGEPVIFNKDCINRQTVEPWADHGCVAGEPFVYENMLFGERVQAAVDWMFSIRMPDGHRPPLEDGGLKRANGHAIFAGIMDRPDLLWDWYNDDFNMGGGMSLEIQHLAYVPDDTEMTPQEPEWKNKVMYDAGQAVFRSGWDEDAVYTIVNAEHGAVHMTVHDHIDSTSFQMFAYGEYLLMDTGYYKPLARDNARTAQALSHNVLIIDGEEVTPKGLLHNFGDDDAYLKNEYLSDNLSYVEAWQKIDISQTERSVMLVHGRYLVTADRIVTTNTEARLHTWLLHGYAGFDEGGSFELFADHAVWQREKAGVEVYLSTTEDGLELVEPPYVENYAPHVHSIGGGTKHHAVLNGNITAINPGYLSVCAPYKVGAESGDDSEKLTVTALSFTGDPASVTGYMIEHSGGKEIAMLKGESSGQILNMDDGTKIETDADFILITVEGDEKVALIARGTMLKLNDVTIFSDVTEQTAVKLDF